MSEKLFMGCDPGLSGAYALLHADGSLHSIEDLPVVTRGQGVVKRELDPAALARLLRPVASDLVFCLVERTSAMPRQGASSTYSLGHSAGAIAGVIGTLGIPHEFVTPQVWKRIARVGADKGLSLATARRRWPTAVLDRAKDHNRAEAALMALVAIGFLLPRSMVAA